MRKNQKVPGEAGISSRIGPPLLVGLDLNVAVPATANVDKRQLKLIVKRIVMCKMKTHWAVNGCEFDMGGAI